MILSPRSSKRLRQGAGRVWHPLARASVLVVCAFILADGAAAHRASPIGSTAGLPIPSVSHGQMVVLADNRAAILELADTQYPTDSDMRRLQSFVNLQYFYCTWGLFPGALTDEESPFNECAHAYLAGVRSLLVHLQGMPGDRTRVRALSHRIDAQMLEQHTSMVLCRFSDEPFNSADVIVPSPLRIFLDPLSLASILILGLIAAAFGGLISFLQVTYRRSAKPRSTLGRMRDA